MLRILIPVGAREKVTQDVVEQLARSTKRRHFAQSTIRKHKFVTKIYEEWCHDLNRNP